MIAVKTTAVTLKHDMVQTNAIAEVVSFVHLCAQNNKRHLEHNNRSTCHVRGENQRAAFFALLQELPERAPTERVHLKNPKHVSASNRQ